MVYSMGLGLNTCASKPRVFPKWVPWVQVQFSFLAHHGTLLPIFQYHRYVQVSYNKVTLIFTVFFSYSIGVFFSKFIVSHCDETKHGSITAVCTSLPFYN